MNRETWDSLRDEYEPQLDDYKMSGEIINHFFDYYIMPNISEKKWNMCISIARRGSQIYEDQLVSKPHGRHLFNITSKKVQLWKDRMEGYSILIFDDSIKTGENVRKILNQIDLNSNNVTVAVLLGREDTIRALTLEYPQVVFESCLVCSEEQFSKFYLKKIAPYLNSICLPIQKDNPTLLVDFQSYFDIKDLFSLLGNYGQVEIDKECVYRCFHEDRLKGSFMFTSEKHLYSLQIFSYLKNFNLIHRDTNLISNTKIRFYFRECDVKRLIFQPFVLESKEDEDEFSPETKSDEFSPEIMAFIRKQFLFEFVLDKIIMEFINSNYSVKRIHLDL